jgi:hypothetical protein
MGYRAAGRLEWWALTKLGVDHDVKVDPDAGHGFLNDHPPTDVTPLLVLLSRLSGSRYHQPSAQDAPPHRRLLQHPPEVVRPSAPAYSCCCQRHL